MVYKFTIISDEVDDFILEIKIDSDATFYDLHKIIVKTCLYEDNQITSFFICNEDWEKIQEVVLEDIGSGNFEEDIYIMRNTRLSELVEEEKQRLTYVFDPLADRMFFMELTELTFGKELKEPICGRRHGNPPAQSLDVEETNVQEKEKNNEDLGEDFYGSEEFESEEFDPEGFEISEDTPFKG